MDELAKRHSLAKDLELLDTIPGVDRIGATAIVAEIGANMSKFPTDAHISSWAGMSPGNNESAGKKKRKDHVWRHLDKGYAGSMCLISVEDKEYLLER